MSSSSSSRKNRQRSSSVSASASASASSPREETEEADLADVLAPSSSSRARRQASKESEPGLRRRGSSVHSVGSVGSGGSRGHRTSRKSRGGKRESGAEERAAREERSRTTYSTRAREHRERRVLDDADDASAYSSRSGRSGSGAGTLSHEDEIERIRELRARRLRNERLERGATGGDNKKQDSGGRGANLPARIRSQPLISRKELEEAGLVRRDRRDKSSPTRTASASARTLASIPDAEIASYSRSRRGRDRDATVDDDDTPRYSRRDRSERAGAQDENSSSYRVRRERERASQDDPSAYRSRRDRTSNDDEGFISSRARRERSDRSANEDDDASGYSRSSDQRRTTTRRVPSSPTSGEEGRRSRINIEELRSRRDDIDARRSSLEDKSVQSGSSRGEESTRHDKEKERQRPTRSSSGGDELRIAESTTRDVRRPPARSKSADLDVMGMATREDDDDSQPERPARRLDREQQGKRSRSNDLTTRLRERREARMAERQTSNVSETSEGNMSSARRRILRQRSNDDALKDMAASTEKLSTEKPVAPTTGETSKSTAVAEKKRRNFLPEDDDEPYEQIPELEFSSDEDETGDSLYNWSIRISVVSAVDLPLNIVPNMPLCPVLKIGLVKLPQTGADRSSVVTEKLGSRSIESIHSARVRSTTSKILSKRDNGTVDFHQEMRWDAVKHPMQAALCIELCARAVRTPKNYKESPPSVSHDEAFKSDEPTTNTAGVAPAIVSPSDDIGEPTRGVSRSPSGTEEIGGLRGLWKKATNRKAAELEAAEAAAAVARMLVEQHPAKKAATEGKEAAAQTAVPKTLAVPQSDYDVTLRRSQTTKRNRVDMTTDKRLGTLVVPMTSLPLEKATNGNEAARVEQWYQLETLDDSSAQGGRAKKPSVLLEISFSSPELLDESEDELEDGMDIDDADPESFNESNTMSMMNASFSRRSVIDARGHSTGEQKPEVKVEDPELQAGVVDFLAVVGCRDIGKLKNDEGTKGWVDSSPESVLLEQFPPSNEFHQKHGRTALLPEMCQWFCFPEGTKLWRGTSPPSHADLNLKRFSGSSPPNVASSIAAFDACLNCTTSFSWFVIASNSDKYGSQLVKTYAAVIRFYAPAPVGIDPTQKDFAQTIVGEQRLSPTKGSVKRLWVPMGICLTSNLPIVGVMEAMLLRLCEELVTKVGNDGPINTSRFEDIHSTLANLIVNFQKPIAGAVNCSVPFLGGERFLLSLPPPTGLPPLPHGRALVSVCRLLGAEGLNFLLAAILTECKILFHSQDIADLAMVAEVGTILAYPFSWSLPYIPILPLGMIEFVEAPLSYMLGIPSSSLKLVDPNGLDDVVVIDLDNGFSSDDYYDGRRLSRARSKSPTPLPASIATNISKSVYRLLRAEEEVEEEFGGTNFGAQNLPRLEQESLAEREFRISVAIEITGLLRGYQECVGPVFNRDKFLKISPALFEERRDTKGVGSALTSRAAPSGSKVISGRSKRFLSQLVNTQNFHQFIESLETDEASFFHEIMETFEDDNKNTRIADNGSKADKVLSQLAKSLQKVEDKIPTYRVDQGRGFGSDDGFGDEALFFGDGGDDSFQDFDNFGMEPDVSNSGDGNIVTSFTNGLLAPIDLKLQSTNGSDTALARLEANPWEYQRLFDIPVVEKGMPDSLYTVQDHVKLRDAIGERRYRTWKMAQDQKAGGDVDLNFLTEKISASKTGVSIDLTSLISSATQDTEASSISSSTSSLRTSNLTPEQQRVADAKHRDVIRRCMDKARVGKAHKYSTVGNDDGSSNPFLENGRDLIAESEKALRSPSAQRFLLSILSQRSRLENQRVRTNRRQSAVQATSSRVDPIAFDCLVRLSCAMLDSCMEFKEYEPAYRLLTHTAGFIMIQEDEDADESETEGSSKHVVTMTSRIGLHPIFADLGVWETVMSLHLYERQSERKSETRSSDGETEEEEENNDELEYEAAVATLYEMVGYGIPGEELSRFAMRASEEHGWFCDDRGRQLLMLARRISIRRDQADLVAAGEAGDIDMIRKGQDDNPVSSDESAIVEEHPAHSWVEIGWCHPAAPTARKGLRSENIESENASSNEDFMKRSPVTALACFGSTVVVTGGLDGSVFMAHSIAENMPTDGSPQAVRGIHLDWGSASRAGAGSSSDGEYGVGAVSCLAAAGGSGQQGSLSSTKSEADVDQEAIMASMEGSRVVAGTTAGDLRVWSVKDVYSAITMAKKGEYAEPDVKGPGGSGNASTRLKFSLRGRALSGHRGGVTCIDVPSYVYRPDSLVTGGADGLIKLWSLRAPSGGRRPVSGGNNENDGGGQQRGRGGDALSVLSGHGGRRIMCIKTAWHGDRLLSGGADRTIRIWDLANSNGKCLHTLTGHFGWITKVDYWGPNTIISAATDRSLALWDARVRNSPLFMLRHHHAPVSDFMVGTRTDPLMISAAADGTIATWDFRTLSDSSSNENSTGNKDSAKRCRVVRAPAATMKHEVDGRRKIAASTVHLARVVENPTRTFLSTGSDAIIREWVASTGELIDETLSGHCDAISNFKSYGRASKRTPSAGATVYSHEGTITTSWDGTVRMRKLIDNPR
jgi:WD40 repeat protein